MADDVVPIRKPETLIEVGGPVDEVRVTLAIYGEELDPAKVSEFLGCGPTKSHRKGHQPGPRSPASKEGAWFLTVEGKAPTGPDELARLLLEKFPRDRAFWRTLSESYRVQIHVGIHTGGWNRGFGFPPDVLDLVAATGASLEFDLYFYGDETDV